MDYRVHYWDKVAPEILEKRRSEQELAHRKRQEENAKVVDYILLGKTIGRDERIVLLSQLEVVDPILHDLLTTPDAQERAIARLGEMPEHKRDQVIRYVHRAEFNKAEKDFQAYRRIVAIGAVATMMGVPFVKSCLDSEESVGTRVSAEVEKGGSGESKMPSWEVGKD